jgi:hypothetical protein
MKRTLLSAMMLALLSTAATAQSLTMVKEIDVTIDMEAIQNPLAATYWTSVSDDVENAIMARLTDRIADDGVRITVDLAELELANGFQETFNIADTHLMGTVKITSDTDNSEFEAYDLTVTYENAVVLLPVGTDVTILTQDSPEFYAAVVDKVYTSSFRTASVENGWFNTAQHDVGPTSSASFPSSTTRPFLCLIVRDSSDALNCDGAFATNASATSSTVASAASASAKVLAMMILASASWSPMVSARSCAIRTSFITMR